jgi:hypothetical protein
VKKTQKKQKTPLHRKEIKKPTWPLFLLILTVIVGLGILVSIIYSWSAFQNSDQFSSPKTVGVLIKPTFSPVEPTNTPPDEQASISNNSSTELTPPVSNKAFASYFSHSWDIPKLTGEDSEFWVEVDLSSQTLFAYRGSTLLDSFAVSTGTSDTPTLPGSFKIYAKYDYYTMRGPGYDLPDVPYSMFFYKGYSIHGTYWHHNFGTPMSHGCVNMETSAAAWLYEQTKIGTPVYVHY